jgi:hypothetical protein
LSNRAAMSHTDADAGRWSGRGPLNPFIPAVCTPPPTRTGGDAVVESLTYGREMSDVLADVAEA